MKKTNWKEVALKIWLPCAIMGVILFLTAWGLKYHGNV